MRRGPAVGLLLYMWVCCGATLPGIRHAAWVCLGLLPASPVLGSAAGLPCAAAGFSNVTQVRLGTMEAPASSLRMFGHVHRAMCSGGCQFEVLEERVLARYVRAYKADNADTESVGSAIAPSTKWAHLIAWTCEHGQRTESSVCSEEGGAG